MAYPDARIYSCTSGGIELVDYCDTEHYQVQSEVGAEKAKLLADHLESVNACYQAFLPSKRRKHRATSRGPEPFDRLRESKRALEFHGS